MAHLSIHLFGPFQVAIEGETASGFDSDKVRALLAYLSVEASRPHRRESLAGLLWPESDERAARTNLRRALANLRQVLDDRRADPPYLDTSRQTVQFNTAADVWLDVAEFERLAAIQDDSPGLAASLEEALALYRGPFLEGFSLAGSAAFEEWQRLTGETFGRQAVDASRRLAGYYERMGQRDKALSQARRLLDLEPWDEGGQRQVMRLLAFSGRRGEAISQYETFRQTLADELGVEPSSQTQALFQEIQAGRLTQTAVEVTEPRVRGYQLRERIGAGSFGVVYRAYQPSVRRDVAVKIIQPKFANQPDFIRRFDVEAQLVARLEHPHIVPLYDYWREPDGAYLVMRWLKGGSLQSDLARGPWRLEPAADLIDQIAAALDLAHRQGVIHRDLKPANILLDEEGNAYLSDFGIAILEDTVLPAGLLPTIPGSSLSGSPEYVSPEQVRGEPLSPLADIYCLGIVLFELMIGHHPFGDTPVEKIPARHLADPLPSLQNNRSDLPTGIDKVIQTATVKDPAGRYANALSLAVAFRQAATGAGAERSISTPLTLSRPTNPYKGLRPFQEVDARDFFGRQAAVERLLARLASPAEAVLDHQGGQIVAVVGPSGCGKSSLVKAGLIPALREGALPGSEKWFIIEMVPGSHPFEELESALLQIAIDPPTSLLDLLEDGERGLSRAVRRALPAADDRLVLVIDQFEELFALTEDKSERERFLDGLCVAVTDPRGRLHLVLTLRADYYDRPLQYSTFGELIRQNTEVLLALSAEELEQAIVRPAETAGVQLDPGLAQVIIADVQEEPGALPLLQYALTELFERHQDGRLSLDAYREVGGVAGAIGQRAESLYANLGAAGQETTRQLFLRLVTPGEDMEDSRRRLARDELTTLQSSIFAADPGRLDETLDLFGRYRLLTFDRDPLTRAPTVEIAHEALLREWPRLRSWIDASREELHQRQRLAAAAAEWLDGERDPSFLLTGTRLKLTAAWAEATDLALTPLENEFLDASLVQWRAQRSAEEVRQARERSLERRSRNLRNGLIVALVVVLIGAVVGIVLAGIDLASGIGQVMDRVLTPEIDSPQAALTRQASRGMHMAYSIPQGPGVAFSPDGRYLATAGVDNTPVIRDAETRDELLTLRGHGDRVTGIAYSLDGRRLATTSQDGTARVWDAETGEELLVTGRRDRQLASQALSPDGSTLAITVFNPATNRLTATIWDVASGEERTLPAYGDLPGGLSFSPDGSLLAVPGRDGRVMIWELASDLRLSNELYHDQPVSDIAFSRDGQRMATSSYDGTARISDVQSGELLATMRGHEGSVMGVDFSADGTLVATASEDGTARVWDAASGRELDVFYGHQGVVLNVSLRADNTFLASGGDDDSVIVWDLGR